MSGRLTYGSGRRSNLRALRAFAFAAAGLYLLFALSAAAAAAANASACTDNVGDWKGVRDCFKQAERKIATLTTSSIAGWLLAAVAVTAVCIKDGLLLAAWASLTAWNARRRDIGGGAQQVGVAVRLTSQQPLPVDANADSTVKDERAAEDGADQKQRTHELSLMRAMPGEPLGYSNTRVGQLVVRGPDWAKADADDDGGAGCIGVVTCATPATAATTKPAAAPAAAAAAALPFLAATAAAAGGGQQQVVVVKWCKTGLETTANVRGGTAGSRKFCVAVMDVLDGE
ncbi:hypothetical protein HXX76_002961 [Chlamydomonas incerta]|uniref:Uncharacterized protein n=1 Tax=Chlamydomonas incerta TaxID=51695 RepID=A0A835TCD4_CHLIN|nr:hypothetical protein HXX76_002961 [Chlamydomonas incerta]|eukprot:KAG2442882.1 hypothetical protein HXX76_002961 [Chlamydomonas incerta]